MFPGTQGADLGFSIVQDECYNYIRVLVPWDSRTLLACGTNSFSPVCRSYGVGRGGQWRVGAAVGREARMGSMTQSAEGRDLEGVRGRGKGI